MTKIGLLFKRIKDMKLIWPFRKCTRKDVSLVTHSFRVEAKSSENLSFIMMASFQIFPSVNDKIAYDCLEKIIKSEICAVAASMTVNEIFKDSKVFKVNVVDKVQLQLNQYGIVIHDAIFEQIVDNAHKENKVKLFETLPFHIETESSENQHFLVEAKSDENQPFCIAIKPLQDKSFYHIEANYIENRYFLIQVKLAKNMPFRIEVKSDEKLPYGVKSDEKLPYGVKGNTNNEPLPLRFCLAKHLPFCVEVKSPDNLPFRLDVTYTAWFDIWVVYEENMVKVKIDFMKIS